MSKADEMFEKCGYNKIDVIDKITGEEYQKEWFTWYWMKEL